MTISRPRMTSSPRGARLPRSVRRAQLLESALEVFVEHGYHAAAVDDIAERAGVSKPVLYQHFPGKLDIYLALLDQACDDIVAALGSALADADSNKDRVVATIETFFDFVSRKGAAYRLVFESDLTSEPQVSERVGAMQHRCMVEVARLIRHDTDRSEAESLLLASGIVGMANTTARYWMAEGSDVPQAQAAELVAALVWRGIRGFPRAENGAPAEG